MASERGGGQTGGFILRGCGQTSRSEEARRTAWEGRLERVRAPYPKAGADSLDPEYRGTRETPWEAGGTTLQGKILLGDR